MNISEIELYEQIRRTTPKNKVFQVSTMTDDGIDCILLDEFADENNDVDGEVKEYIKLFLSHITNTTTLEIFKLRMEGYKFQEIGDKLDMGKKTVQSKYHRVLSRFRRINNIQSSKIKKMRITGEKAPLRKVINLETNVIYDSINKASKEEGIAYSTLIHYLNNTRPNKTQLRNYK